MSAGKVTQQLYLTGLPDGGVFTVTSVTAPQDSDWYTYFSRTAPFTVTGTQQQPGYIGESVIQTQGVFGGGTPPYVTLAYSLQVPVNGQTVTKTGYLSVNTTAFGEIERPDYSLLTFNIEGQPPQNVSQEIPDLQDPDPIYVGFAVSSSQVLIAASTENLLSSKVLEDLIDGVIDVNEELVKWVIEALL
ncbi:MAG TPA: hypothetical protein VFQ45_07120 [Longimicrobium sp.]|nr:hypothetical protein [Longimicrobium sp.]